MYNKATALKNITFVFIFFYFLFIKVVSKHTTKLQGQLATTTVMTVMTVIKGEKRRHDADPNLGQITP